jgi:hypothetical protein
MRSFNKMRDSECERLTMGWSASPLASRQTIASSPIASFALVLEKFIHEDRALLFLPFPVPMKPLRGLRSSNGSCGQVRGPTYSGVISAAWASIRSRTREGLCHPRGDLGKREFYSRADLKIANTAPCGSATTDMRPTPSMVVGGRQRLAPIFFAFEAAASTSSTWK